MRLLGVLKLCSRHSRKRSGLLQTERQVSSLLDAAGDLLLLLNNSRNGLLREVVLELQRLYARLRLLELCACLGTLGRQALDFGEA